MTKKDDKTEFLIHLPIKKILVK